MKLYEVNELIEEKVAILEEEGGEVNGTTEELMNELFSLQMERARILEYLAKLVINTRSDIKALKDEEDRLKKKRKTLEHKADTLINVLDRECDGVKTNFGVATLYYRKSESIDVTDRASAIEWLKANGHDDCIRQALPEVVKDGVKKIIKEGGDVPGTALVTKKNPSLR